MSLQHIFDNDSNYYPIMPQKILVILEETHTYIIYIYYYGNKRQSIDITDKIRKYEKSKMFINILIQVCFLRPS